MKHLPRKPAVGFFLAFFLTSAVTAQRHGGGGGMGGGSGPMGGGRATGLNEKDDLKDFHHAMDVQATPAQVAGYKALLQSTEAARSELKRLAQSPTAEVQPGSAGRSTALDQAVSKARGDNKTFVDGFSAKQKAGLKEITKKLTKADADVGQQESKMAQIIQNASSEFGVHAGILDKALAAFYDQQLALGREMGIDSTDPQQVMVTLPVKNAAVRLASMTLAVPASATLSQISADGGQRTFRLEATADLSDLQQNFTQVLRVQLDRSDTCGQRVAIKQATLAPSIPSSKVSVELHYERWTCVRVAGQAMPSELAEGEGAIELKLTPSAEAGSLTLKPEIVRVEGQGMVGDALRSGAIGEELRDKVNSSILSAMQAGTDFQAALPPAARDHATIEAARFLDPGMGKLKAVLDSRIQLPDEQANQMVSQLRETPSTPQPPSH